MGRIWTSDGAETESSGAFTHHDGDIQANGGNFSGDYVYRIFSGYAETPAWTAVSELIAQFRFGSNSITDTWTCLKFLKGSAVVGSIVWDGGTRTFKAYSGDADGAGTLLGQSSALPAASPDVHLVQVRYKVSDTLGEVEVRCDFATILGLTGRDTKPGSDADVDRVRFANSSGAFSMIVDDAFVNAVDGSGHDDGFAPDIRMLKRLPTGAGATTGLTPSAGSNWQCVDDRPPNGDTDYVTTSTSSAYDTYAGGSAGIPGGSTVVAVNVFVTARSGSSGNVQPVVRTHATDYEAAGQALSGSYAQYGARWNTNPTTGSAWTISEVDASEFGVGLA